MQLGGLRERCEQMEVTWGQIFETFLENVFGRIWVDLLLYKLYIQVVVVVSVLAVVVVVHSL